MPLYFIILRGISNFDASNYTIAAVINVKRYKYGIELFFDKSNFIKNYVEDTELEVSDVVLDPNSYMGVWLSEDIAKVFPHSVFNSSF